ncbi:DMT family transporter [Uliginosibacterium paludis]|uniref:DMT family transporter n=1 Tax=Uliginosibacterium paludis TaxID=1615952 RepID=A0ABV2CSU8_9RHOO
MPRRQLAVLTALAMLAFAANSLLCRAALRDSGIDAASFTTLRMASGGLMLCLLLHLRGRKPCGGGNWGSGFALFAYAAGFSFAYLSLPAATGALLLFAAVQATMIGQALRRGERFGPRQLGGLVLGCAGLILLLLPGLSAPPLAGALLMLAAGAAWGVYSLRGRGKSDPLQATAGNFLRALPFALLLSLLGPQTTRLDAAGFVLALASGALASGAGYAVWYSVLPALKASHAGVVQFSVPVIAALGGVLFLGEPASLRLLLASVAILGGIALVIAGRQR